MTNDQADHRSAAVPVTNEIPNPKSEIRNPKSEIRNRSRRGVTLLEVLFAIMVASVGILGAISVFPVALAYARKGRLADTTAVGGDSAIGKFNTELMNRPDRWLAWDETNNRTRFLPANDQVLNTAFIFGNASVANTLNGRPLYGRAFCIDPPGFEHNRLEDAAGGTNTSSLWSWFPAVPETNPNNNAIFNASRMVRLTLHNNNPSYLTNAAYRMSAFQADLAFRIEDELMYERPKDNSLPAVQLYNQMATQNGNVPSRRQEEGRLSWMATLVPKVDRLHDQLGEEYVLSIVVLYNRTGEALHVPTAGGQQGHPWNEWTAKILGGSMGNAAGGFFASGIGGGEVRITTNDPNQDPTFNKPEYLDLKHGSWVMLGRTIPGSAGAVQYFQWYRVSDADETQFDNGSGRWYQDVTLVGPDWPVDLKDNNSGAASPDGFADECDVIIMPHVIHVYERTIKIDTGSTP